MVLDFCPHYFRTLVTEFELKRLRLISDQMAMCPFFFQRKKGQAINVKSQLDFMKSLFMKTLTICDGR